MYAYWITVNYREAYGLFACTGILANHESPMRPERFVTQKIVRTAARIAGGSGEVLRLGNTHIQRDWGWAPEYVDAMWRMLQQDFADDYVIATGRTVSLEYFTARVFEHFGLNWNDHVEIDTGLFRPTDILINRADPTKAKRQLGWTHTTDIDRVVSQMCAAVALSQN